MPDIHDDQKSEAFDFQRYLGVVRRRYPHFVIALFFGWLIVWGASWIIPARYKSSTLILVEQPTMPKDYVTPNVNQDVQGRLANISQQILSRTRLLRIADEMKLYRVGLNVPTPDETVARMRKDIEILLVRDTSYAITAFNISFSSSDPRVAQRVTGELTRLFIDENLEVRQHQSEDTTKFLEGQLETARQSLSEQEAKIRQFKGAHIGDLPSQQASNLQILSGMQSQLRTEEDGLSTAQQQRVYLQSLISQYKTLQVSPRTVDGAPTGLPAIDQQLEKLKEQLADLSSHYTEQHPDIRKLKLQISETEKMRDRHMANLKSKADASQPDPATDAHNAEDPQESPAMLQLQGQLRANEVEIGNHQRAIENLKAQVGQYQARLNEEPVSEQQLADLTRGYDQSRTNYDNLLKKESDSKMATSMEQMQQGERFRMLDPPSLPLKPAFPDRLKFCAAGLGFGLLLGVVVAGGFEFLDDRLHDESQIKALLPMKVISEIPEVVTVSDERSSRIRMFLGLAMAGLIFAVIAAGSLFSFRHS
jgi:succinoglycan biosynthesis transport protein ExoP